MLSKNHNLFIPQLPNKTKTLYLLIGTASIKMIKQINSYIKKNYFILIILIIFFALRIPALNQDVYGDEYVFYYYSYSGVEDAKLFGFDNFQQEFYFTFFIPNIFYMLGYYIIPSIIGVRLISLIFGFCILLLGMKLLYSFFNRRAAIIFGILFSLIPWPVFTSILLDNDGTVICFSFLLLLYFTIKLLHNSNSVNIHNKKYFFIIGVISGFLIFLKFLPWIFILIFNTLFLAYFAFFHNKSVEANKSNKKSNPENKNFFFRKQGKLLGLFFLGVLCCLIFFFMLYLLLFGFQATTEVVRHYFKLINTHPTGFSGEGFGLSFFIIIALCSLIISPIVLLFILIIIPLSKNLKERYLFFIIIFHVMEILGTLYLYNAASLNRYASFLIIPLLLVISIFLSRIFDKRKIFLMILFGFLVSIIYFLVDLLPHRILDFYPKINPLLNIIHGKWNFLVPINGANGPIGIYISFINIIIPYTVCTLLIILIIFRYLKLKYIKHKYDSITKYSQTILVIVIISLSFCYYVSLQFSFSITSPSINKINKELRTECASNDYYIFRNSAGFAVQNNQSQLKVKNINFGVEYDEAYIKNITESGENVCINDFPQINKNSTFWKELTSKCKLQKEYYEKKFLLGYWFKC